MTINKTKDEQTGILEVSGIQNIGVLVRAKCNNHCINYDKTAIMQLDVQL